MRELLGAARPPRGDLEKLVLDLLRLEWATEKRGPPACLACGIRNLGAHDGSTLCMTCRGRRGIPSRLISLGDYGVGLGRLLAVSKYAGWGMPLDVMGWHLGREIMATVELEKPPVLIPMPSPWLRRWHRGLDHTLALSRGVSRATGWPIGRWLRRAWVAPQVGATRAARVRGGGGLRVRRGPGGPGGMTGSVVLVDDVRTTGASLGRASRLCRTLGAQDVLAAVVAVRNQPSTPETSFLGNRRTDSIPGA
ncbi:MAG: hypothetical protein MK085_10350 [Phycisphaerales bacterium]|nr:hypothetical protein [Phycisphaerales bacterium]